MRGQHLVQLRVQLGRIHGQAEAGAVQVLGGQRGGAVEAADGAEVFDGISFNAELVWGSDLIELAQARGLKVFVWTARAEDAENTIEEYYAKFILSGADGIFADQPDLLAACVRDMS